MVQFLKKCGKISSGPEALLGLRFFKRFSVPIIVIEISSICFMFLGFNPWNHSSSPERNLKLRALGFENTDSNCLLRMVACWVGSVYVDPSDFRGEMPVHVFSLFSVPLV